MSTLKINVNAKMVITVRHLYKGALFHTDVGVSGKAFSVFKQRKHLFLKIPAMFRLETICFNSAATQEIEFFQGVVHLDNGGEERRKKGEAEGSSAFFVFEILSCVIVPHLDFYHCSELQH